MDPANPSADHHRRPGLLRLPHQRLGRARLFFATSATQHAASPDFCRCCGTGFLCAGSSSCCNRIQSPVYQSNIVFSTGARNAGVRGAFKSVTFDCFVLLFIACIAYVGADDCPAASPSASPLVIAPAVINTTATFSNSTPSISIEGSTSSASSSGKRAAAIKALLLGPGPWADGLAGACRIKHQGRGRAAEPDRPSRGQLICLAFKYPTLAARARTHGTQHVLLIDGTRTTAHAQRRLHGDAASDQFDVGRC